MHTARPAHAFLGFVIAVAALFGAACSRGTPALPPPPAPRLTIAAASSLRSALPELIDAYASETRTPAPTPVYASSGNLVSQISSKAPYDVFLSADEQYPVDLLKSRHAVGGSLVRYATGRIALWVPAASPLDVSAGLGVLTDDRVKKIAIANPALAPYGVAAEEAMKNAGVYDAVRGRLVLGENIAQAAQFVESGAAQVGVLALPLVLSPAMKDKGRSWVIPDREHAPIIHSACVSAYAPYPTEAERFMAFLQSETARGILRRHGFGIPGE